MKKSERQKALERIGKAYLSGGIQDPADIELANRSDKGGRPVGTTYQRFYKRLDFAWVYICARKMNGMTHKEAFAFTKEDMKMHIEEPTLYRYCSYYRSGITPDDTRLKEYLEHARAALEQVENGFMKLPNHPDYKPRT